MAYIEGRITTVSVDGTNVAGVTEASLTLNASEIETTTHGTSKFKSFISGRKDGTVSLSCLWDDSDTGQQKLVDSWADGTVLVYIFLIGSGGSYDSFTCDGLITDLSYGTPNDDVSTIDITIRLTGTVAIA